MNYLYVENCTDKNNLEIFESKFTSIEPQILSLKSAEVNYSCYVRYQLNNEYDSYIAKDLSYTVHGNRMIIMFGECLILTGICDKRKT